MLKFHNSIKWFSLSVAREKAGSSQKYEEVAAPLGAIRDPQWGGTSGPHGKGRLWAEEKAPDPREAPPPRACIEQSLSFSEGIRRGSAPRLTVQGFLLSLVRG